MRRWNLLVEILKGSEVLFPHVKFDIVLYSHFLNIVQSLSWLHYLIKVKFVPTDFYSLETAYIRGRMQLVAKLVIVRSN